jgi:hypothetical protein
VSQTNPIFQGIINAHFPALNTPAPVEAEEEYIACDNCGQPSTHDRFDEGDYSVGISSSWVPFCDACDSRRGR